MVVRSRNGLPMNDEEIGKRDDDHRPDRYGPWNTKSRPAWRKRRIAVFALAALGIWLFIHYIPTDLVPVDKRYSSPPPPNRAVPHHERQKHFEETRQAAADDHPAAADQVLRNAGDTPSKNYEGPIKFLHLAATLRASSSGLYGGDSTNILFAASDLGSAAALIPLACEMASVWKKNPVHFVIMGRSEIDLEELKRINGVQDVICDVAWHDARPDYSEISSEGRMEISVAGALGHINQYLKPVAVITTDMEAENTFFSLGLQRKIKESGVTHIQVPIKDPSVLGWLTRLDHASLGAWHSATFDVLVRAPLDSSGSLVRLLKSLSSADYTGFTPPRLVIELPHRVDPMTRHFLDGFRWPPPKYQVPGQHDQLTIRRRITDQRENAEEASLRFIESFYPTSPAGPHVLLLSPQVELSPVFFHYLKLHLLEYKHSMHAMGSSFDLFGISLETPSTYLNGSNFVAPGPIENSPSDDEGHEPTPFRWQAPNGNAALYFADKWMEVHSFVQKRHTAIKYESTHAYFQDLAGLVSIRSPAWVEYFLEFMRIRGWSLHYPPALPDDEFYLSEAIAVVHNELYQLPEEFSKPIPAKTEQSTSPPPPLSEPVLAVQDDYLRSSESDSASSPNAESALLQRLDNFLVAPAPPRRKSTTNGRLAKREDGYAIDKENEEVEYFFDPPPPGLPTISSLPLLDNNGEQMVQDELLIRAEGVRILFREYGGGCSEERAVFKEKEQYAFSADDLFCFDEDEAEEVYEDDDWDERLPVKNAAPVEEPSIRGSGGVAAVGNRVAIADHHGDTAPAGSTKKAADKPREPPKPPAPATGKAASPPAALKAGPLPKADIDDDNHYKETTKADFLKKLNTLPEPKPNTNRNIKPDADDDPILSSLPDPVADANAKEEKVENAQVAFPTLNPNELTRGKVSDDEEDREESRARAQALEAVQKGETQLSDHDDDEFIRLAAPKVMKGQQANPPPRRPNAGPREVPREVDEKRQQKPQPKKMMKRRGTEDDPER